MTRRRNRRTRRSAAELELQATSRTSLMQVVNAAAWRFDERPLHRASVEARTELQDDHDLELQQWRATWGVA